MASSGNNGLHGQEGAILRKFGINEKYQMAMYLLDQYRGTCLACRYTIPTHLVPVESRTQLEETVRAAIAGVVMRHPMLQVCMVDATSKNPSWSQLRSLDLKLHINWLYVPTDVDLEQTVQDAFRVKLDDRFPDLSIRQPHWKFTFIRQENTSVVEGLLAWNHPQFDGIGAKVLHEDLLEILNDATKRTQARAALDGNLLTLPQARPLLPIPLEALKSLPVDLKVLAKAFWEESRPQFLNRDVSQALWCPIRSTPYKTQYRVFFIDNAKVQAIVRLCRQNQTTITGLMNGLLLLAFSSRLDSATAPAFQSSTIVDHRRNLPPAPPDAPWGRSDRAVSNYVTQLLHKYPKDQVARIRSKLPADAGRGDKADVHLSEELQHELWEASAQSRLEIVRKIEDCLRNDILGLFKWVSDWQQTMSDIAKRPRQFTWLVTNVGVLDGGHTAKKSSADVDGNDKAGSLQVSNGDSTSNNESADQSWSIDRAQFGLSAEIHAAAMEFSPLTVAGCGMSVSANWLDCAVDVAFAEGIMADLERWLIQLGSQS